MKELHKQSKLSAEIAGPLPGPSKRGPQRQSPYSRGAVRGSKPLKNTAYGGVSVHMDSPDEDSQTTRAPLNVGGGGF